MKKKAVLILLLLFAGATFAEEKEKPEVQDLTVLSEKMDVMEKYIKKIVEEIVKQQKETEELKKDVEKLKETSEKLSQVLRNLEIYVKSTSSIRPEISKWESVKTGMSSEEVEKILGQPEEVREVRRVGTTWYYYGLGSITFNEKGGVAERKNFKQYPPNPR